MARVPRFSANLPTALRCWLGKHGIAFAIERRGAFMKFEIKFDPPLDDFSRNLERQVKAIAKNAIEAFGQGLQVACDEVYEGRKDKSADVLFAELRANLDARSLPVSLEDEKVRTYAEAIAQGRRINVKLADPI
jgi:hypothetical protein